MVPRANNVVPGQDVEVDQRPGHGCPTPVEAAGPTCPGRHYHFRGQFRPAGRRRDFPRVPQGPAGGFYTIFRKAVDQPIHKLKGSPMGEGRDHPPHSGEGPLFRARKAGVGRGQGQGAAAVPLRLVLRPVVFRRRLQRLTNVGKAGLGLPC